MHAIAEFFEKGGVFMYINAVVSVVVIATIVDRAIYFLGRSNVNTKGFLDQLRKLLSANNVDLAVKLCSATKAPEARVAKAALSRLNKGEAVVTMAIEETLVDVTPELKKRVASLWSLANIGTLIGLLGTVTGLIKTFAAIGLANPADQKKLLSDGIAEAMNNTAVGLGIAVVCMIGHLFLNGMSKKRQGDLEAFSLKLENMLSDSTRHAAHPGESSSR